MSVSSWIFVRNFILLHICMTSVGIYRVEAQKSLPQTEKPVPSDFITTLPTVDKIIAAENTTIQQTVTKYYARYGVMLIQSSNKTSKACAAYYPELYSIPQTEQEVSVQSVVDEMEWDICSGDNPPHSVTSDQLMLLNAKQSNSCTIVKSATIAQKYGYGGVYVIGNSPPALNLTNTTLRMSFISNKTYQLILSEGVDSVLLGLYSPPDTFTLNYSLIIIWLLAVTTVTIGSFWSGRVRNKLYEERRQRSLFDATSAAVDANNTASEPPSTDGTTHRATVYSKEEMSLDITPRITLLFAVLMCVMLVALYFLYGYLVYVIIALFSLASVGAVYSCLEPLVMRVPCGTCRTPYFNLWLVYGQLELRQLLLILFALGLTITWLVFRNHPLAWILQDILGFAFCINMLKTIRLPNLKICTVLLSCLFFYDIFFVFITPLITPDGTSIMVEVAQGGGEGGEQLPMVFKVPHFIHNEVVEVCSLQGNYNLLGFGDILVPGLLLGFVYSYDLKKRGSGKFPIYFFTNVIAYGLGLGLTFAGLYLMRGAQPALLYLVPCTLVTTVILAAIRADLAEMWRGDNNKDDRPQDEAEETNTEQAP